MISKTLVQEIYQLEADFCSALSDPTRLLILCTLADKPRNVTELSDELNVVQPTLSRHLKVLRERGLVFAVRKGSSVTYHLSDSRLIQALDLLRAVMRDRMAHRASLVDGTQVVSNT
ncbi:MAG TPA: metalloregulator ArsR/SmtB family transcription factor [Anaerolineales bacterium]|nr:metalloregulator ArsR/SmtB family transcription factor [Anaerolineales bacterium]